MACHKDGSCVEVSSGVWCTALVLFCVPVCTGGEAKYSWSQMRSAFRETRSKLVFQLFNGVRPLDGLSSLIIASNKIQNGPLKLITASKMVRLEKLALYETEPNLNLIKPRCVGGEPIELHRQFALRAFRQLLDPLWELLGGVGRTIIKH